MANTCKSNLQKSLAWCQGKTSVPGIRRRIYYISKNDIVSWPSYRVDQDPCKPTNAVLEGSFELAADSKWKFIDVLPDKCQVTSDAQGEYPSQTQLNKLVAVHPGVDFAATNLASYVNNDDCVFLVETMEGFHRVVGSETWQSKCTVTQDLGQGPTGTTSTTLNVEVTDLIPTPFYFGNIVTEDGTITASKQWEGGLLEDDTQ